MKVALTITPATALAIYSHVCSYFREVADGYNAPDLLTWDNGFDFATCCGNKWSLYTSGRPMLVFQGSRDGWRSHLSAFGAEPLPGKPGFARIAGRFLARIEDVESSGGAHGEDPWLWGWQVAARCREDEALLAPLVHPWEGREFFSGFAKAA